MSPSAQRSVDAPVDPLSPFRIAIVGLGSVGEALVKMLLDKSPHRIEVVSVLRSRFGATALHDKQKLDLNETLNCKNDLSWLQERLYGAVRDDVTCPIELFPNVNDREQVDVYMKYLHDVVGAHAVVEVLPVNYQTAEPALSVLESAIKHKLHAVSANKAPVVHAHARLSALAAANNVLYRFESAVMDGVPVFNMLRNCLSGATITGLRGVLNSTTNVILTLMEAGQSFETALKEAQEMGIAEADPTADIDGWDAAVKVGALFTVLRDRNAQLKDSESDAGERNSTRGYPFLSRIPRDGIRHVTSADLKAAAAEGMRYKVVCTADLEEDLEKNDKLSDDSESKLAVRLVKLPVSDPLASLSGASSAVTIFTKELGPITLTSTDPTTSDTAFGVYQDLLECIERSENTVNVA